MIGKFCITYNGEVYNFEEIRRELEKEGGQNTKKWYLFSFQLWKERWE